MAVVDADDWFWGGSVFCGVSLLVSLALRCLAVDVAPAAVVPVFLVSLVLLVVAPALVLLASLGFLLVSLG